MVIMVQNDANKQQNYLPLQLFYLQLFAQHLLLGRSEYLNSKGSISFEFYGFIITFVADFIPSNK